MKQLKILTGVLLLFMTLAGCAEYANYTPNAVELTAIAEQYHGADKEAVQGTAVARYLAAEQSRIQQEQAHAIAESANATANAAAASAAHQLTMLTAEAQQTVDARNASATGTAQALSAQATTQAISAQATIAAQSALYTTEARASEATATERAYQATATQETYNQQATHTAATSTAVQHAYDQQATCVAATATVRMQSTLESQQATAQVAHATMTRQAEKREEVLGYGRDYGIPVVLIVISGGIIALIFYGLRKYDQRPIVYPRNFLGDADPVAIPATTGGFTFLDLDRQPGPAITVHPDGTVVAPQLRSAAQEERTTARDQTVDQATRPKIGAGHHTPTPPIALSPPPTPPAPGLQSMQVLRRLDLAGRGGLIAGPLLASLKADWETTPDEEL